jgi:hypothetical protein
LSLLKIDRDSGYADRLRAYQVMIDGAAVGEIRDGEAKEFPVSAGRHEMSLKIDWCGSKTIGFGVAEGDVLTFHAKSNLRGLKLLVGLWYAVVARHSYLSLEQG